MPRKTFRGRRDLPSRRLCTLLSLLLASGCGAPAADRPAPQGVVSPTPRPSPRSPATSSAPPTWYFGGRDDESTRDPTLFDPVGWTHGLAIVGSIELENGATLEVLQNGLRWISRKNEWTAAAGLVLPHVVAVARLADGTFAAVDTDGRFAHFREPLGPVSVGHATLPRVARIVAGRHGFLALTEFGPIVQSHRQAQKETRPGPSAVQEARNACRCRSSPAPGALVEAPGATGGALGVHPTAPRRRSETEKVNTHARANPGERGSHLRVLIPSELQRTS